MSTFLYNPNQKNKQELLSEFVVRQDIYEEIIRDLEGSNMQHPEQHFLLVGQRGMGKTTLLLRIKYGIDDSAILKGRLLPISFTEEQYQIGDLVNLWEYVAEYLEDHYAFTDLYDAMSRHSADAHFEEKAFDILDSALQKEKKGIVLLIDNIGDLFHKLELREMHRLREVLQTNNKIRVIGGSTNYWEGVLDYQQPFYEFFKIQRLDGLDSEETIQVIRRLGEVSGENAKIEQIIRDTPGRIETLRILTGGVPRTISIMFGIFLDHEHEHAIKDLYKILDLVTPLYKHRMDDLPVQQQKIVDAVARNWEPIAVKELAARTRLMSKTLSAQLNQLEKEQIVVKHDTATKNKTYMIRERFWNIWYLMRYGRRDDREKIIWLVKFLESWLSGDELKKRIESFVEKVKNADIGEDQLQFLSKVYAALKNMPAASKLKLKSIEERTKTEVKMNDEEWFTCAREEFALQNYTSSMKCFLEIEDMISPERLNFLKELMNTFSKKEINTDLKGVLSPEGAIKVLWLVSIISGTLHFKAMDLGKMDAEKGIIALKAFFEIQIGMSELKERTEKELAVSIGVAAEYIGRLVSAGLYNSVLKIFDETFVDYGGSSIFIKDYWKPLYLAVKFLHQRDELEKQPAEIGTAALALEKKILAWKPTAREGQETK